MAGLQGCENEATKDFMKNLSGTIYEIREESFNQDSFMASVRRLNKFLNDYQTGAYSLEDYTLCLPNWLTTIKGYSLKVQGADLKDFLASHYWVAG
jgi:hypothetical protein